MARKQSLSEKLFWQSGTKNNAAWIYYFNRLTELAVSMFKWTGLPETVDERFLELVLFSDGHAVFFEDEAGYLALRCALGGQWNVYNIPEERHAYSNGDTNFNRTLTSSDSVIIYNNLLHINTRPDIAQFADKLWDLDRTIEVNARAQKTPVLLSCDETQRLTLKNMYKEFDGNAPVIFGDKELNPNTIKAISTGAPYVADKLYELKTQIWNEALTYLGIPNVSVTKKERLITDEVQRNQGGTIASRNSRLLARQQACEQINQMFGLNVWCDFREYSNENDSEVEKDSQEVGEYE